MPLSYYSSPYSIHSRFVFHKVCLTTKFPQKVSIIVYSVHVDKHGFQYKYTFCGLIDVSLYPKSLGDKYRVLVTCIFSVEYSVCVCDSSTWISFALDPASNLVDRL